MKRSTLLWVLLAALLLLPVGVLLRESPAGQPVAMLEMGSGANTLDGCTACGCRLFGDLAPGEKSKWWWTFGSVEEDEDAGWRASGSPNHCGAGSFGRAESGFQQTIGHPYVILDLAAVLSKDGSEVRLTYITREFSGFDEAKRPDYTRRKIVRTLGLQSAAEVAHPFLLPDERERQAFAVHDVVVHVRAERVQREPPVAYGSLAVTADVPGAEILLDGGFVGRISAAAPVVLQNVPVGRREVVVRDFSGREARREVSVKEGSAGEAVLDVLSLPPDPGEGSLIPIGTNPQGYEEYWRPRDGVVAVRIPAGEFLMGSADGRGQPDERPQHKVHVSEFLIDKTEVTWRQFREFAAATGGSIEREPISGSPDHYPASFIIWDEAKAYCEWVGGRLPTEAEWEKAARGTDGREYPWGDRWDARRCNSISGGLHQPESVGSYPACVSPYGVLDMPGSMWEWCADRYAESTYEAGDRRDPAGPDSGRLRVKRGGAWMSQPTWVRAAYRGKGSPTSRNADHGFRCAHDAPEER
jgi:formylglycine-generating enzyme required for sulfatase activity